MSGALALLVDINALAQLVSIGTLFCFYMVDLGVLVRRYHTPASDDWRPLAVRCAAMLLFNIGAGRPLIRPPSRKPRPVASSISPGVLSTLHPHGAPQACEDTCDRQQQRSLDGVAMLAVVHEAL